MEIPKNHSPLCGLQISKSWTQNFWSPEKWRCTQKERRNRRDWHSILCAFWADFFVEKQLGPETEIVWSKQQCHLECLSCPNGHLSSANSAQSITINFKHRHPLAICTNISKSWPKLCFVYKCAVFFRLTWSELVHQHLRFVFPV